MKLHEKALLNMWKTEIKKKKKRRGLGIQNAAAYNSQPLVGAGRMMPRDRQPNK